MSSNISSIAQAIKDHRWGEWQGSYKLITVARVGCNLSGYGDNELWITNLNLPPIARQQTYGMTISKNSMLGGVIIQGVTGRHTYAKGTIDIENFTTYIPSGGFAKDLTLHIDGDNQTHFYRTLQQMIDDDTQLRNKLVEEMEKQKRLEEERERAKKEQEAAERAAKRAKEEAERLRLEEEARRLEEERRRKEEEERIQQEEIERLNNEYQEHQAKMASMRNFIREGVSLRSQHILDPTQEMAKRSHFYDGVPIVIEGGPGTGKTTTMIQRLKFLLDTDALSDYQLPLKHKRKN